MNQTKRRAVRRIGRKIKRRLAGSKGMSIGELLFSVLIMLLSTSVLTTTVTLGVNQYLNTLSRSEANVLSSTLQSIMTSELGYTQYAAVDKNDHKTLKGFQSQNYTLAALESKKTETTPNLGAYMFFVDDTGKVRIGDADNNLKVLGDGSYPNNLIISDLSVEYYSETHMFTVSYTISRKGKTVLEQEFQIININRITADEI